MKTKKAGFSLIEILISVGILGIVVAAGVSIYLTSFRNYNRSQIMNHLQEEGQRVFSEVSRVVRSSTQAQQANGTLKLTLDIDSLEYEENGNCKIIEFALIDPGESSNAYVQKSSPGCTLVDEGPLTNTDAVTGTNVDNLTFVVTNGSGLTNTQLITISLSLSQGVDAPTRGDYQASVSLETQVATRGY